MESTSSSRRVFGRAASNDSTGTVRPGRLSLSRLARWRDAEAGASTPVMSPGAPGDKAPIPSALPAAAEARATPLPTLSMLVLSITLLGEFLTANVSMPFILFMVEGFKEFKGDDEADVGFWTGILVSTFFLTQFVTSLLWATIADRHGARLVLTICLFGGSVSCALFGTATSMSQAIAIRLAQGVFAGSIGVARGCVARVTDASNEGRAYAVLGFCWGFGGVAGAIVGGLFETPAAKWPGVFSGLPLFVAYPYFLPTLIAASVTFLGGVLSLFLAPDGGPRGGAIALPIEKDEPAPGGAGVPSTIPEDATAPPSPVLAPASPPRGPLGGLRKASRKISGYFGAAGAQEPTPPSPVALPARRPSRVTGSAYGYTGVSRARLASGAGSASRRGSNAPGTSSSMRGAPGTSFGAGRASFGGQGEDLNFAQRLLLANENAVNNISDLWVAAAMNVDNESVFESDDDEDEEEDYGAPLGADHEDVFETTPDVTPADEDVPAPRAGGSRLNPLYAGLGAAGGRRASGAQARRPSRASIFAHPGVRTPQPVLDAQRLLDDPALGGAAPAVPEGDDDGVAGGEAQAGSVWAQLPVAVIVQYGLLALHTTTHDMIFLNYLVSKYESGGLNLNAGHFSQLTALMCLFQIAYQFYLYPNIGPPRGRFSHLSMFRIGTLLFIPGYVTVTFYRVFASAEDDGNAVLMAALSVSAAVRFAGSTFAYTAIAILLNYMSPPPLVGLANGIGQSIVSLARFVGPILGGFIWSEALERGGPGAAVIPFWICGGICVLGLAMGAFIR